MIQVKELKMIPVLALIILVASVCFSYIFLVFLGIWGVGVLTTMVLISIVCGICCFWRAKRDCLKKLNMK